MTPPGSLRSPTPEGAPAADRQCRIHARAWSRKLLRPAGASALTIALTIALTAANAAPADPATAASLADLGLALLRQPGPPNAVVSPVATAIALGMVHAGTEGVAEREIEALFGPRPVGRQAFRHQLPTLLNTLAAADAPFTFAGRLWMDPTVATAVPAAFRQRLATRYRADAAPLDFRQAEAARGRINAWTAERTAGRVAELLPPGSVSGDTRLTLSAALHFRSAWAEPFDAALTEPRPFGGGATPVPTMTAERAIAQAVVDGTQLMSLPFGGKGGAYTLLLALPAAGGSVDDLLKTASGARLAQWQAALQPQKCAFAMPKFSLAPRATALRPVLEALGLKTVFTSSADLRPMLGRAARGTHLGEVFHAAGITVDEQGGEAVAAAAATVQAKSLGRPLPACAVDRPFVFAVLHGPSGAPLFLGRVGDPALAE
jgi:serpin B